MLLVGVFLISAYVFVFYFHRYDQTFAMASFAGMLISYCCVISFWIKSRDKPGWRRLVNIIVTITPFFLMVYGLFTLAQQYRERQLTQNGVPTIATVIGFKTSHTRGSTYHYAVFEYSCDQKYYLQKVNNDDDFYRLNDTLRMVCSSNDPEIFKILTVKHLYNKVVYHIKYK